MRNRLGLMWSWLLVSPAAKTSAFVLFSLAASVLSGAFIVEITDNSVLAWTNYYKARSFYGMIFLVALQFVYQRSLYVQELRIDNYRDDGYCIALMRQKAIPEIAQRCKEQIRNGKTEELKESMSLLEKILRQGKTK